MSLTTKIHSDDKTLFKQAQRIFDMYSSDGLTHDEECKYLLEDFRLRPERPFSRIPAEDALDVVKRVYTMALVHQRDKELNDARRTRTGKRESSEQYHAKVVAIIETFDTAFEAMRYETPLAVARNLKLHGLLAALDFADAE